MRRVVLSLASFLVLFIFAQHFAEAAPKKTTVRPASQMPYACKSLKASYVKRHQYGDVQYRFKGVCTIKDADGRYQDVWIKSEARWQADDHSASERVTVLGPGGGVIELSMKCEDNPWLSNARCALLNFGNTTEFSSLVSAFRVKKANGIVAYPPLSRGATGIDEAIKRAKARRHNTAKMDDPVLFVEDDALDDAFDEDESDAARGEQPLQLHITTPQHEAVVDVENNARSHRPRLRVDLRRDEQSGIRFDASIGATQSIGVGQSAQDRTFYKPTFKGIRLHYCLHRNKGCGMIAANRWCQIKGFRRAQAITSADNIGRAVHVGDSIVCRSATCDGFHSITCQR